MPARSPWLNLQTLVLEYRSLGQAHPRRAVLREQLARQLAGAVWACTDEGEVRGSDDLLTRLIREELNRHKRREKGDRRVQQAFGGTNLAVGALANNLLLDRAESAGSRVTFLSATLGDWRDEGSLEGFVRQLVRHFLADTALALERAADPKRTARNPQRRERLLSGARSLAEIDWPTDVDGDPVDFAAPDPGDELHVPIDALRANLHPLDQDLLDLLMGEGEMSQNSLAIKHGRSVSSVSDRKHKLIERLKQWHFSNDGHQGHGDTRGTSN